jgi:hypothetical protein
MLMMFFGTLFTMCQDDMLNIIQEQVHGADAINDFYHRVFERFFYI